jgi:hypothetical protein
MKPTEMLCVEWRLVHKNMKEMSFGNRAIAGM